MFVPAGQVLGHRREHGVHPAIPSAAGLVRPHLRGRGDPRVVQDAGVVVEHLASQQAPGLLTLDYISLAHPSTLPPVFGLTRRRPVMPKRAANRLESAATTLATVHPGRGDR